MKRLLFVLLFASPLFASDLPHRAGHALAQELFRYRDDAKALAVAPLHWNEAQWTHFAEGAALVASLYAVDRPLYDAVQRNRSKATNQFASNITQFGGGRAMQLSVLMIAAGAGMHDTRLRDAGRDALEAEIFAAGIVTPALKRAFGRARPIQDEGTHSFHPLDGRFQSFPSGHATNAFALATAVAGHYDGWIVPTIAYTVASGVACSRVNDRAHFPSDVVAGALIGHAVAKSLLGRHGVKTQHAWRVTPIVGPRGVGLMIAR